MTSNSKDDLEKALKELNERYNTLLKKLDKALAVVRENGLEEELGISKIVSTEEQICVDGITHLSKLFKTGAFTKDDANILDILHKNLRLIRGLGNKPIKKSNKKASTADLLKIVENTK